MGLEQFPLTENALPRVKVPVKRFDAWKEVALDEVMRAISNRESWYNAFKTKLKDGGYEMIADEPQLKAFMRGVPNSNDKDILIRSTLQGVTLDDLVAGFYVDNTYDARCSYAHMYEDHFLDGGVLQVHEGRDEQDPLHFVGMKWACVRSPAPTLMKSRDFLYFTFEGTAEDADGNRVLFRFLRSMPMDDIEVDDSDVPSGHLVRGKISNLHLYRQNGSCVEGYTKVMHSNAGNMPSWVVSKTVTLMFPGIINMETISDARALLAVGMAKLNVTRVVKTVAARAATVTPATLAAPNSCGACFQKFKMTRAKRRCTSCNRVVCKRCTRSLWLYDEDKLASSTGCVAMRFCMNCMRQARTQVQEVARHSRTSRTSSHSQSHSQGGYSQGSHRPRGMSNASHGSHGSHGSLNAPASHYSHGSTSNDYHQQRKYSHAHSASAPHRPQYAPQYEPEYSHQSVSSSSSHHYAPPYNAHSYQQGGYQRERGLSANSLDDTSEYSPYGNPRELESDDDGAESYDSRGMRRPHRQHPHPHPHPHQQLHGSQSGARPPPPPPSSSHSAFYYNHSASSLHKHEVETSSTVSSSQDEALRMSNQPSVGGSKFIHVNELGRQQSRGRAQYPYSSNGSEHGSTSSAPAMGWSHAPPPSSSLGGSARRPPQAELQMHSSQQSQSQSQSHRLRASSRSRSSSRSDSYEDPQRPMSPSAQYAYEYAQEQLQIQMQMQQQRQQQMPYNARMLPPMSRSTSSPTSSSSSVRDPNGGQMVVRARPQDPDAVQDMDAMFRRQMQLYEGDDRGDEIQKALLAAQLAQQGGRPQTTANAHPRYYQ